MYLVKTHPNFLLKLLWYIEIQIVKLQLRLKIKRYEREKAVLMKHISEVSSVRKQLELTIKKYDNQDTADQLNLVLDNMKAVEEILINVTKII